MDKKVIVVSGPNLVDGGPISVFLDFLRAIVNKGYCEKFRIIALVGKKELFKEFSEKIELIEFRKSKSNWLYRLFYEYIYFNQLSRRIKPYVWISMHDMTPNVKAKHRYVYCHNPSPFNNMSLKEVKFGVKYYLFSKFYKYLYAINIKKNDAVIVQQEWMRNEFKKMFGIDNVIVARPSMPDFKQIEDTSNNEKEFIFVFPSFPRYYKNFQFVCEAAKKLEKQGKYKFKVIITLDGTENSYSNYLYNAYGDLKTVKFTGLLSREKLFSVYGQSSCMLFMSKLETWGMPITEYKMSNKPLIVADLPYAHETVGNYSNVSYINPDDVNALANSMELLLKGEKFTEPIKLKSVDAPYADNWDALCELLF